MYLINIFQEVCYFGYFVLGFYDFVMVCSFDGLDEKVGFICGYIFFGMEIYRYKYFYSGGIFGDMENS